MRLEMLQVARLAPALLGDAVEPLLGFLAQQWRDDGGAADRAGHSDLYYSVFTAEALIALRAALPEAALRRYLQSFAHGEGLDLVHLTCLARCWAALDRQVPPARAASIAAQLARYRAADGGFAAAARATRGNAYHSFLALGAYQDLGVSCPQAADIAGCLADLRARDGGFGHAAGSASGSTTVTAAAVTVLRQLDETVPEDVGDWLLARAHPAGGFTASPGAPAPDLLSTATALHALAGLHVDFSALREICLDFVDSLWTGRAFCGHWADDVQDSEYTYYALLALGHLSL